MPARTLIEVYDFVVSLHGTPYQWGGGHDGSGPQYGLDCSGFVRRVLAFASAGPNKDYRAQDYYEWFLGNGMLNTFGLGALAFFGTTARIHHVGWCIDKRLMFSAAGGGSHVNTLIQAQRIHAWVKPEPIHLRKDFVCCIMPYYQLPLGA